MYICYVLKTDHKENYHESWGRLVKRIIICFMQKPYTMYTALFFRSVMLL